jgi:hypothetical protein
MAGASLASNSQVAMVLEQTASVQPVLQRADGSYVGTVSSTVGNFMLGFTPTGSTLFTVPTETPQIATAGGGVIGASGTTYDQNGNVTGQTANLPTFSWTGSAYQYGSTEQVADTAPDYDESYAATAGGNPTGKQTAIFAVNRFYRQKIAENAASHLGDSQTWNEKNKPAQCNQFVHDVLEDTFGEAPDVFHQHWKIFRKQVPAVAADWADETKAPEWQDVDGSKPFASRESIASRMRRVSPFSVWLWRMRSSSTSVVTSNTSRT